jgi:hypothetical protein
MLVPLAASCACPADDSGRGLPEAVPLFVVPLPPLEAITLAACHCGRSVVHTPPIPGNTPRVGNLSPNR